MAIELLVRNISSDVLPPSTGKMAFETPPLHRIAAIDGVPAVRELPAS